MLTIIITTKQIQHWLKYNNTHYKTHIGFFYILSSVISDASRNVIEAQNSREVHANNKHYQSNEFRIYTVVLLVFIMCVRRTHDSTRAENQW